MSGPNESGRPEDVPWQQKLYESVWLLAGLAIVIFVLSYLIWGIIDLISIASG